MLPTQDYIVKKRAIWRPGAWRLLREAACTRYARRVIPQVIAGINVEFPETIVTWGARITVASRHFDGEALINMLYQPAMYDVALDMGMAALKALQAADIGAHPFAFFSKRYNYSRMFKVAMAEIVGTALLSMSEKKTLKRLVFGYFKTPGKAVLVHGDLQASHLLINASHKTLCLIDLEAMRVGKPVTNFVQLWDAYYQANPVLGRRLYQCYMQEYPDQLDEQFDADARAELALRSHSNVQQGLRSGNQLLTAQARFLLASALSGVSFAEICLKEGPRGNIKSL